MYWIVINKYFSFLLLPILTFNRVRITPWRGNPIFISNIMVDTSETSPITCMVASIERKTPIREFLFMQNKILSKILWKVPISLMEPREFLERRLDPLGPGLWINMRSHNYYLSIISVTRALFSTLSESESFAGVFWAVVPTSDLSWSSSIFFPFYFISKKLFPIAMCWWLTAGGLDKSQAVLNI